MHIPKKYKELQKNIKATFVVMYNKTQVQVSKKEIDKELDILFHNSSNTVQVTMAKATQIDGMIHDGIL